MAAELHLAEDALALHLFLQHPEGLVDIVVTDENLHAFLSNGWDMGMRRSACGRDQPRVGRAFSRKPPKCPPQVAQAQSRGRRPRPPLCRPAPVAEIDPPLRPDILARRSD